MTAKGPFTQNTEAQPKKVSRMPPPPVRLRSRFPRWRPTEMYSLVDPERFAQLDLTIVQT